MSDNEKLFSPETLKLMVGEGGTLYSDMIGTAVLALENGRSIELRDALLVRELGCNLLSSRKLLGNDMIA